MLGLEALPLQGLEPKLELELELAAAAGSGPLQEQELGLELAVAAGPLLEQELGLELAADAAGPGPLQELKAWRLLLVDLLLVDLDELHTFPHLRNRIR